MIPFANNSDKTLYVFFKTDPRIDTLLKKNYPSENILPNSVNTTCIYLRQRECFEGFPNIIIFILDWQIVSTTSYNIIERDYLILRRYDLTRADLQLLNWEVPYPPDERMKNMKMYPPYESE
jgi:hypothetical protein